MGIDSYTMTGSKSRLFVLKIVGKIRNFTRFSGRGPNQHQCEHKLALCIIRLGNAQLFRVIEEKIESGGIRIYGL